MRISKSGVGKLLYLVRAFEILEHAAWLAIGFSLPVSQSQEGIVVQDEQVQRGLGQLFELWWSGCWLRADLGPWREIFPCGWCCMSHVVVGKLVGDHVEIY